MKFDCDVAGVLHDEVWHVGEVDRLSGEVSASHTEIHLGVGEHLETERGSGEESKSI